MRSRSRWYSSTCRASASHTIKLFLRESWNDASSRRKASRASSTDEDVKGDNGTAGVYATDAYEWNFLVTRRSAFSSFVMRVWMIASGG